MPRNTAVYAAHERNRLSRHPRPHRPAVRTLLSDLPLRRQPLHKGRHHGPEQGCHRRRAAADPGRRQRHHRRAGAAAAQHRQLPQAAEHLRRVHDAGAGGGGDGAQHRRGRPRCSRSPTQQGINVVPRTGGTATEGGLETIVPELDRARRLGDESHRQDRPVQHAGDRASAACRCRCSRIACASPA